MDLVIHQVNQLEDVGVAHGDRLVEGFAAAAIDQLDLAWVFRVIHPLLAGLPGGLLKEGLHGLLRLLSAMHLVEGHHFDAATELRQGPAHQTLEHLTHIHAGGNAEGVKADFDRSAISEERHIFDRNDLGDDALIAVAASHLVTDLELLLGRDVDLDLLD